jgi:hypothetical protein
MFQIALPVGKLPVKEWLKETHSEYRVVVPSVGHLKHLVGRPFAELSKDHWLCTESNQCC